MFEFLVFSFLLLPFIQPKYLIQSNYTFRTIQSMITVRGGALVQVLSFGFRPAVLFSWLSACFQGRVLPCLAVQQSPSLSAGGPHGRVDDCSPPQCSEAPDREKIKSRTCRVHKHASAHTHSPERLKSFSMTL